MKYKSKLVTMWDRFEKWDRRFLNLAKFVSTWSKDPSTKVGAVITDHCNRIVSLGYNGFPAGMPDDPEILNNRELKYKYIIHAEENAISYATRDLKECHLYTYPFMPCSKCTEKIIKSGIEMVFSISPTPEIEARWGKDLETSRKMLLDAGVGYIVYTPEFLEKID